MKKIFITFFSSCLFFLASIFCNAQTGTTFWFAAPDILSGQDEPIALVLSTYDQAAQVTISLPANSSFTPINLSISANQTASVNLSTWKSLIETSPGDIIRNTGLLITSDNPITAYYEVQYIVNKEMFTLKGSNALGFEFYTPFQTFGSNGMGNAYASFEIVATADSTNVTINPTKPVYFSSTITHPANVPFTRVLNAGQTYSVRAVGYAPADRMSGSYVSSDKPIAITMKDDLMTSPIWGTCSDLIGDQLVPVEKSGNTYIIPEGLLKPNIGERAIIVSCAANTKIFLNGNPVAADTLDIGETKVVNLPLTTGAKASVIQANKNITILHLSGNGCEYGASIIPPIDGGTLESTTIAFARSCPVAEAFNVMLITLSGNENSFTMNGSTTAISGTSFQAVPGTSGQWVEAMINLGSYISPGQACRISNSMGGFHCGVLCGGTGSGCGYGYFTEYHHTPITSTDNYSQQTIDELLVYPNPSYGFVNIISMNENNMADGYIAKVFDMQGRLLQETPLFFNGTYSQLNFSNAVSGIYFLTIMNNEKIVKQQKIVIY